MIHASLFTGLGGFDWAAELAGWTNSFQCEINPFARKILRYYWPEAELFENIITTDFTKYEGLVDVLSGGFPCQPYSVAGQRKGTADDRHLWPHMLRAIRQIKPRYVVGENVRGLVNWSGGLVFDEVQSDLETEGYDVIPFLLPACAVNAPHRRDRIWFIAHRSNRLRKSAHDEVQARRSTVGLSRNAITDTNRSFVGEIHRSEALIGRKYSEISEHSDSSGDGTERAANTKPTGLPVPETAEQFDDLFDVKRDNLQNMYVADGGGGAGWAELDFATLADRQGHSTRVRNAHQQDWRDFPTQSPLCNGDDGLSCELDATAVFGKACKPAHARTFARWRNESIKAGGNAIVPQVALQIFDAIEMWDLLYS